MFKLSDFGITRNVDTLSNGIRLVTFERRGMPLYMEALFFAGSRFDPPGKEGLSHFTEHMIVAGSKKFPSKDQLAVYIERLGGMFGAATNQDWMLVHIDLGDPEDFATGVKVLSEILLHPLFNDHSIEAERGSIIREIGEDLSKPDRHLATVARKVFFQGTPLSRSTLGTIETLNSISKEDVQNFYRDYIHSGRMCLVVGGDIEITRVKEELEKGLIMPNKEKFGPLVEQPILREKTIVTKRYSDTDQVYFRFGFRTPNEFSEEFIPLGLIGMILGGGRASSLQKRLRYEKGLVYSVSAGQSGMVDRGMWNVAASTSLDKLPEVLAITQEEVNRAYQGKITEAELQFVKDKATKSSRTRTQTIHWWVKNHIVGELFNPEHYLKYDEQLNKLSTINLDDLNQVAKKYLQPDKWYFAATGNINESDIKIES